jgi:hypothetical protein
MAAAVHRNAIEGELQRFTLRVTRRAVPIMFSMMLVQASERRSSAGRPSLLTVRIDGGARTRSCWRPSCRRRGRGPGGGGRPKLEDQPHAKQIAYAPQPPMRSADKAREPVPVARDAERPVSTARRKVRSEG